jgi:hypothetical protein
VEIRRFFLAFPLIIAHWNVYPVLEEQPQAFIFYFNSLTVPGAQVAFMF